MKYRNVEKMIVLMTVAMSAIVVSGSPWALPVKVAVEASEKATAEKVAARAGAHAAGEAAVRGGAALAAATARHEAAKAAARAATGKAVEKATPGKILATGVAAALVVGAHEMADGVQTMSECVGKAIEDNPDAAVDWWREMLSLPKAVITLAGVSAMVVLTWLLWPFVTLVRNWLRLAVARKTKARVAIPLENGSTPNMVNLGNSGFARISLVWIVAFLLLTVLGIWSLTVSSKSSGGGILRKVRIAFLSAENKSRVVHRDKVVAELRKKHSDEMNRIYKEFLSDVDFTLQTEFGRVRAGIPDVVKRYGTISRCAALVKTIVLDKWKGGNRTEESVRHDLETTYYVGLYAARDRVAECLQMLAANLESSRCDFAASLKAELASAELPGDGYYKELLVDCGERIEKRKHDLAVGQIVAGVSVAIEAICIRQTVKVASRLLGRAAARQVGTIIASTGAAVADGPLPIGDIIGAAATVGCTAWTCWDVYQATKILPAKLSETLMDVTTDCERQCRGDVLKAGEKLFAQFSLGK